MPPLLCLRSAIADGPQHPLEASRRQLRTFHFTRSPQSSVSFWCLVKTFVPPLIQPAWYHELTKAEAVPSGLWALSGAQEKMRRK